MNSPMKPDRLYLVVLAISLGLMGGLGVVLAVFS